MRSRRCLGIYLQLTFLFFLFNSVGPKTNRTSSSVACVVSPDRLPVHSVWTDAGTSPGRRSTSTRKSKTWPAECAVAMSNLLWLVLLGCVCFCYKIDTLLNQKWKILIRACWWRFCCWSSFYTHCIYNYSFLKIKAMFKRRTSPNASFHAVALV